VSVLALIPRRRPRSPSRIGPRPGASRASPTGPPSCRSTRRRRAPRREAPHEPRIAARRRPASSSPVVRRLVAIAVPSIVCILQAVTPGASRVPSALRRAMGPPVCSPFLPEAKRRCPRRWRCRRRRPGLAVAFELLERAARVPGGLDVSVLEAEPAPAATGGGGSAWALRPPECRVLVPREDDRDLKASLLRRSARNVVRAPDLAADRGRPTRLVNNNRLADLCCFCCLAGPTQRCGLRRDLVTACELVEIVGAFPRTLDIMAGERRRVLLECGGNHSICQGSACYLERYNSKPSAAYGASCSSPPSNFLGFTGCRFHPRGPRRRPRTSRRPARTPGHGDQIGA